jgi:hypothetical protein
VLRIVRKSKYRSRKYECVFSKHFLCQDTEAPFSGRSGTLSYYEGSGSILMGPFRRVYVELLSPIPNGLTTDASTSCLHVLARHISHHSGEVARCWICVSTLYAVNIMESEIAITEYGEIRSRTSRGSANGWTETKTIITTIRTLSTAWVTRMQWEWCRKAWHRLSCPFQGRPTPL